MEKRGALNEGSAECRVQSAELRMIFSFYSKILII